MLQVLTFRLDQHIFAFKTEHLVAVTRMLPITPVARSADFFFGLINLRGKLVPVIDLRSLFFLPQLEDTRTTRLIAVKSGENAICVRVDCIEGFLQVSTNKLEPPPDILFDQYISTVYKQEKELVLILNNHKLVDKEEVKKVVEARKVKMVLPEQDQNHQQDQDNSKEIEKHIHEQ